MPKTIVIDAAMAGWRLDRALCRLLPGASLRAARRMLADSKILLNGKPSAPGATLRKGQTLAIDDSHADLGIISQVELLAVKNGFFFFCKPPGMHSAALAGRANASLEMAVPDILAANGLPPKASLLQRLDFGTGGIIVGAASDGLAQAYRRAEKLGQCDKYYYAVLCGELAQPVTVKNMLDCRRGGAVRLLGEAAPPLRWTMLEPMAISSGMTLARCHLKMGQRHQIRAHAASLGHPLAGDSLYGGKGGGGYMLEHCGIRFPGQEMFYLRKNAAMRALFGECLAKAEQAACMS